MDKKNSIFNVLYNINEYKTSAEKKQFDSIFSIIEKYAYLYHSLTPVSTDNITFGSYTIKKYLTADKFNSMYYTNEISKTYTFIDFAKYFLKNNCYTYLEDNTYKQCIDRQAELLKIEEDKIIFIHNNLRNWYLFMTVIKPNLQKFLTYLDNNYFLDDVFNKYFSSIEKDKQVSFVQVITDEGKKEVINNKFNIQYNQKSLSNSIAKYLTSWFNNGTNSSIVFCDIHDRLKTISKYIDRFYSTGISSTENYCYFNGKYFDNYTHTYVVSGDNIKLDMAYSTSVNINTQDTKVGYIDNPYRLMVHPKKLDSNQETLDGNQGYISIGSSSPNYNTYGVVNGDGSGTITEAYYGYIKPLSPLTSYTDGYEYIIAKDDNTVKTFCYYAMSGSSALYLKFLDYIYDMKQYKSQLKDESGVSLSSYFDSVYNIVK